IIIDTNIWISFLLSKQYPLLDALLESNAVELVFSNELLDVTATPRLPCSGRNDGAVESCCRASPTLSS
ncbi:MAG: hypothetical protein LBD87_01785, partial [Prevotellaceae bacterium]|nr:hypothetical protein [Prevotellaceae bacterium]